MREFFRTWDDKGWDWFLMGLLFLWSVGVGLLVMIVSYPYIRGQ